MSYVVIVGFKVYGLFNSHKAAHQWGMNTLTNPKETPWRIALLDRVL